MKPTQPRRMPVYAVLAALAVPLAIAQPKAPPSPPGVPAGELKAPALSTLEAAREPRPQPGVLEGRTLPPPNAQQAPAPNLKSAAPVAFDSLLVRNTMPSAAWVSYYNGTTPMGGACLQPQEERLIGVPRGAKMRAEITRDPGCTQRVCDASTELSPGTKGLELRAAGNACVELRVANGGQLKYGPPRQVMRVKNTSNTLWLWVTRYGPGKEPISGFPRNNIQETKCLGPGQSVDYTIYTNTYYDGGARKYYSSIQGEFVQRDCRHPRPCTTGIVDLEWWARNVAWNIHYDPQGAIRNRFPQGLGPWGSACGGTLDPY